MPDAPRSTLTLVAEGAGVSVSTASRALRGLGEMSPQTRDRVLRVADALGYPPTGGRRGRPRRAGSLTLDLVLGQFHDPYTDEVTAGARTAAARLGYDLVLTAERDDPDDDWPVRIRARGSAGVLVGLILPTSAQLAVMRAAGIPVVLIDPPSEGAVHLPSVRTTDRAGGAAAARHLVQRGAQRFIVIGGAPSYRYGRAREEGFSAALGEALPGALVVRTDAQWNGTDARRACTRALAALGGEGPIGVFACSDEMAAGAYSAVAAAGMSVPRDVLVVGFDDVRGARWLHPPLTTIRQPIREMAAAAVQALALAAGGTPIPSTPVELPTELIVRGSTRRAPTS